MDKPSHMLPARQNPNDNMPDFTLYEYIEDCTEQLFLQAQLTGIKRKDIVIHPETAQKLQGYKDLNSAFNPPNEKEKNITRLDGLAELEASVTAQAEALGSSIDNYRRPELPPHLQVQIDSIAPLSRHNSSQQTTPQRKHIFCSNQTCA